MASPARPDLARQGCGCGCAKEKKASRNPVNQIAVNIDEREFKRAIALNPHNAEALSYYALFLAFAERYDEASSANARSLEIDPLSPLTNMNIGWAYFSSGSAEGAWSQADKMIEIEPGFYGAYWLKGETYRSAGKYEDAIENLEKAVALGGPPIVLADHRL